MSSDTGTQGIPTPECEGFSDKLAKRVFKDGAGEVASGAIQKAVDAVVPDAIMKTRYPDHCETGAATDALALALKGVRGVTHMVYGSNQEAQPSDGAPRRFTPVEPGKTGFFK